MQKRVSFDRRNLLKGALLTAATGALSYSVAKSTLRTALAAENTHRPWETVDANVSLFHWPFRRLPYDSTSELVDKLRSLNIQQAWAGSFEGILHGDVQGVNTRLAEACREAPAGMLLPFGSVNPLLPDWEEDVRRCHEDHQMPGIRLYPNYHGYTLDDPRFERLLKMSAERGLLVQLAATLEDTRTQWPQVLTPDVDLAPLPNVMQKVPAARVMLLNYKPRAAVFNRLAETPSVIFDIARVEGTDGIAQLMAAVTPDRVVFGTHAPFLVYESALIKVYESQLSEAEVDLLLGQNARRLLASR